MPDDKPHRDPDSSGAVEAAIRRLRDYYEMGRESLEEAPDRVPYGSSSELLRKARVFAQRYSEDDLDRVFRLCRRHNTALGRSFIDRIATIHDKRKRKGLESEAIRLRWSRIVLDREIRRRFGRRKRAGRTPFQPETVDDALSELIRLTLKLTRWGEAIGWKAATGRVERDEEDGLALDDLPDEVIEEAKRALRAAMRLQEAAEAALAASR